MKRLLLIFAALLTAAQAQPNNSPTNTGLLVNKTTGLIVGPVSAETFGSANGFGAGGGSYTFTPADFNLVGSTLSIDYTNAQKATGSLPGFLTAADWTVFNAKASAASVTAAQAAAEATAAADATSKANAAQAAAVQRANHTGTQAISTITGLQAALDDLSTTGVSDGDKGDISITLGVYTVDANAIDTTKIASAVLKSLGGLTGAADKLPYFTGTSTAATTDFSSFARTLLDDANAGAMRATLGLAIGSDVQAYNEGLASLAGLTGTNTIYYRSAANTWSAVTIGSGLNFSGGSLTATGSGSGDVTAASSFGTDGAVIVADGTGKGVKIGHSGFTVNSTTGNITMGNVTATTLTPTTVNWGSTVMPAANGGAGTINGILRANGSGTVSAAVSGTDYEPARTTVSQAAAEAGTSTTVYAWTPERVSQAIAALAGAGGASAYQTLTDGATITWAVAAGYPQQNAEVTLAGNRTLAFSGLADGMRGLLKVTQDGTGSRTLTLPANSYVQGNGAGLVTLTTTAGATDLLGWTYDGTNLYWDTPRLNFTNAADVTAPSVSSRTIPSAGTTLVVVHNETVTHGAGGNGGHTLSASGGAVTATYSSGAGSHTLTYSLSRTVNSGETVTHSYTQPGNGIEDTAGNDLVTFSTQSVTNSSTQSPSFSPSDISGLRLWLDAETLGLANDASVTSWTDLSGNANHATVQASADAPVYKTSIVNSKAVVRFNGTTQALISTGIGATSAQTWFIVVKRANTTNGIIMCRGSDSQIYSNATNASWWSPNTAFAGDVTADFKILVAKSADATTATLYNGNTAGTTFNPTDSLTSETAIMIGAINAADFAAQDVAAVLVYNSALGDTDRQAVANYLGTRFGITP